MPFYYDKQKGYPHGDVEFYKNEVDEIQKFASTQDFKNNASINGNVLTTNIVKTQGSVLNGQGVATRTGWRVEYKGAYYPAQGGGQAYPCMIRIALKEKVAGIEKLVTFNMVTSASSVSLEPSSLEF